MAAVAKRLIVRGAAAAQRHSVARFITLAIRGLNRNAPSNPERPTATKSRIFDDADRRFQRLFDFLPSFFVMKDQPARRAMHCFAYDQIACVGIVCLLNQAPNLAAGIAEASKGAEVLGIAQNQRRSVDLLRLSGIRDTAGSFRPVEAASHVAAVAEWCSF